MFVDRVENELFPVSYLMRNINTNIICVLVKMNTDNNQGQYLTNEIHFVLSFYGLI